ncbi:MAG: hypothetical protein K2L25_02045 [Alphaproteobacteria bacterium]|nr:hypothetical protein [Alphaproteobacteria bacterium]
MSKKVQIRRGTAAQHETFIGAEGEITMDTTNKTLRVHDGATPGGHLVGGSALSEIADYVIETQTPTAANNYTWYRKYKSGWIEQGGYVSATGIATVTLPIPLTTLFTFCRGQTSLSGTSTASHNTLAAVFGSATTTSVNINGGGYWFVNGVA